MLTKDGRVRVKQSLDLIDQTAGRRNDVAVRHAENRTTTKQESNQVEEQQPSGMQEKPKVKTVKSRGAQQDELKEANIAKAMAESRRVQALADKEEMERDKLAGSLIPRDEVDAAMKFIGAQIWALADVYADQTAPLVAPITDLNEVHEILSESRKTELMQLGEAIQKQRKKLNPEDDQHAA